MLALPCPADDSGGDREKVRIEVAPLVKAEGTCFRIEGDTLYPDGVVLQCELRFFERPVPGAAAFVRVRQGRIASTLGPVSKDLLPGRYEGVVRFVFEDQAPDVYYRIQDETDAEYSREVLVGTDEDLQTIESRYREVVAASLGEIEAMIQEMGTMFTEAQEGKRWKSGAGLDIQACETWTRGCGERCAAVMEAMAPFQNGGAPYRPELTQTLEAAPDALHVLACMHVKFLCRARKVQIPAEYEVEMVDVPPDVVRKQVLQSLQPVREYLQLEKKDDR